MSDNPKYREAKEKYSQLLFKHFSNDEVRYLLGCDPDTMFKNFASRYDPSRDKQDPKERYKYLGWLAKMVWQNKIRFEDMPKIRGDLEVFDAHRKRLVYEGKGDINSFQKPSELFAAVLPITEEKFDTREDTLPVGGYKIIYQGNAGRIVSVTDERASQIFGKNTRWCISGKKENHFDRYFDGEGSIYIFIPSRGKGKYVYTKHEGIFRDDKDLVLREIPRPLYSLLFLAAQSLSDDEVAKGRFSSVLGLAGTSYYHTNLMNNCFWPVALRDTPDMKEKFGNIAEIIRGRLEGETSIISENDEHIIVAPKTSFASNYLRLISLGNTNNGNTLAEEELVSILMDNSGILMLEENFYYSPQDFAYVIVKDAGGEEIEYIRLRDFCSSEGCCTDKVGTLNVDSDELQAFVAAISTMLDYERIHTEAKAGILELIKQIAEKNKNERILQIYLNSVQKEPEP